MRRTRVIGWAGLCLVGAIALAPPAGAEVDVTIQQAKQQGLVGEQADGYLGIVAAASVSADVRAHVDQINILRRAVYAQRAGEHEASVLEMAAAVACQIFHDRIPVGERYRDEAGTWRAHTLSAPVAALSFCGD